MASMIVEIRRAFAIVIMASLTSGGIVIAEINQLLSISGIAVVIALAVIMMTRLCSVARQNAETLAKPFVALAEGRTDIRFPTVTPNHEASAIMAAGQSLLPRVVEGLRTAAAFQNGTTPRIVLGPQGVELCNQAAHDIVGDSLADLVAGLERWRSAGSSGVVEIAGHTLSPHSTAIVGPDGTKLGHAVELVDLSDQIALNHEVETVVLRAALGDLSQRVAVEGRRGTARALAEDVNRLLVTISKVVDDLATQLEGLATGDLTRRIDGMYEGVFARLKGDFNGTAIKLAAVVKQIGTAADHLNHIAGEVTASSMELSERGEKHAASMEEAAAALEELTATVRQNSTNAQQANVFAAQARDTAGSSAQVVTAAIAAMGRIEDSSTRIGAIVGMIEEIAFQTNLLALNAAVEAARAGDAGKGFAVVAQEVRNLAQRSADASKEIKGLIAESGREVTSGAQLVKNAGNALEQITGSIHQVAAIVEEIALATREQSTGIDQVTLTISELDEATQKNAALVEESAATAQSLEHQAAALNDQMAFFLLDAAQAQGPARHAALVLGTKIDHQVFRQNVIDSIVGKNNLTADKLPDHHCCRLGKWYDSVEEPLVKGSPWFTALLEPHKRVHASGKAALSCHASGNGSGRQQALEVLGDASEQVLEILDSLARDIREGH